MIYVGRILKLKCTMRFVDLLQVRLPVPMHMSVYPASSNIVNRSPQRTRAGRRQGSQTW